MLERTPRRKRSEVIFVLSSGHPIGEVSVVGDFNGRRPGLHPMAGCADGSRAAAVVLPAGDRHGLRYLAEDGHWRDEEGPAATTAATASSTPDRRHEPAAPRQ
ncbi:hypothetical protein NJL88_04215 [Streptomyces sp. DK15]|uniref:hypothetical protein n=1 Tax=Streptomyces sp. DK15 TaxID=2957499 RepID=UPI0029A751D1|nr:hypothetical protein [Streptomyces sp. DK15]MDX2389300.1 hypothetical protein [Streptomyces sp. DK15]